AVSYSGHCWPCGKSQIKYALHISHEPRQTNDRQALATLIEACNGFIPPTPEKVFSHTWMDLAEGALRDICSDNCWVIGEEGEWLRPYVGQNSPAWLAVAEWEGK